MARQDVIVHPVTPGPVIDQTWFTDSMIGGWGSPLLIVGEDCWGLCCNGGKTNPGDFVKTYNDYFTTRGAQGYNAIEISLLSYEGLDGGSLTSTADSDGQAAWSTDTNPSTTPNSTYWTRRDNFFASAYNHGFVVFVNATCPSLGGGIYSASWTTTQWQDYGAFLGARYANQKNICWIVGDDYFGTIDSNLTSWLASLRGAGGNHPVSIQNYQETTSRKDIYDGSTKTWGNTNAQYSWGYSYNVSYDVVEKAGIENSTLTPIPYGWMDGYYIASGGLTGITDANLERRMLWWAFSSGAKSMTTGDNDIWPWGTTSYGFITSKSFYTSQMPGITGAMRAITGWHKLVADTSSVLVTSGRGTHISPIVSGGSGTGYTSNSDSYVTAARVPDGSLAVIYMSHATTIGIDQTKMVSGYTATWVDPASGATSSATPGSSYNSSTKGTNSVGDADWVLVLRG